MAAIASGQTGADWPQWRGPNGDGISLDSGLLKEWPEGGPVVAWEVDTVGEGYSSVAIKDGRVLTQGNVDGLEKILALSVKDGSTIWAVQPGPIAAAARERVQRALERGDSNGDGRLEEAEMLKIVGWDINQAERPSEGDAAEIAEARVQRLLAALDKDGDGLLGRGEAGRAFGRSFGRMDKQSRGADADSLPKKRAEALLEEFDKNGNGELDREELGRTWARSLMWYANRRDP